MAASIYVANQNETLAGIKAELLAAGAKTGLELAELGVKLGRLLVPDGKTIKDVAEAVRKAKTAAPKAEAVAVAVVEAPKAEEVKVVVQPEPKKANVALVNGRWACQDCGTVARKLRLLTHMRTCASRN